ncbi:MAG: hypothetical protein ACJ74Z_13375 [Bryobacteraceae bacterium]
MSLIVCSLKKVLTKFRRTARGAFVVSILLSTYVGLDAARGPDEPARLLLTPKRLKRLQRDHDRQTARWISFENRVNSVPDSSERGFELALYYAVTRDEVRGKEAIQWALAHRCATRQVALILDWCAPLVSDEDRQKLTAPGCAAGDHPRQLEPIRDALFMRIVRSENIDHLLTGRELEQFGLTDARELYAACEYIQAVRQTQHVDLREDDTTFFRMLPAEFLLSMKPAELAHPRWQGAAAALALVTLDPNLEASQFLQGWAIEDRQMIREGPGVAYELLWGDPYLPGVSYQNLDPWSYDPNGRLLARTNWSIDACWIDISTRGVEEANCSAGWQAHTQTFGRMTLMPMTQPCTEVPHVQGREAAIIWRLPPHQSISYVFREKQASSEADAAGLWLLPGHIEGKVCTSANPKQRP